MEQFQQEMVFRQLYHWTFGGVGKSRVSTFDDLFEFSVGERVAHERFHHFECHVFVGFARE